METEYGATSELMKQTYSNDSYKYWLGDDNGVISTTYIYDLH
jgi:hypothetical protein